MSTIRFYIDEDSQDQSLIRALCARGVDILTVRETQTEGLADIDQLRLATQQQRVLYSHNTGDFCQIHTDFVSNGETHSGIALLSQNYSIGEQIRGILELMATKTAEEMEDQLEFLSSYSFNPSTNRTVGGALFPPERGTQYEVGIKADLTNRLSATLAAYEITKTNVATTDPSNTNFSIATGEVRSRGIEFDLAGEILPGWNIIASAFVNDAIVSKDNDLPVGDRLVNAPSVGASLWTTYEIQDGDWKGFGFGGGLFFVGNREAQLPNTFEIPSYVRADATIFYKRDNWRVGLNFKNITDTRYYESQGFYLRPGAPFTVLGTISVNF
jgi:hypothetical protein